MRGTIWFCLMLAAASASAATLSGRVKDQAGAVLPGVTVEIGVRVAMTDGAGAWRAYVPPGTYDVAFRLINFTTVVRRGIVVAESAVVDATLAVTASASIVVTDKKTFVNLADLDEPANDMIGIAAAASVGVITAKQLDIRPVARAGDVLEAIPGVIVSQHSGEGKANQYYLRGFNLDHGTDLAATVAGAPVNMPTHAHGQGYSDENFLIPELISAVQFKKGPYYADEGDFASAGAVNINYVNVLERPIASLTGGSFGYRRALAAGSQPFGGGILLGALELSRNNGPWVNPDGYRKINGLLRYTGGSGQQAYSVTLSAYDGRWSASDQLPERAVRGGLSRYGEIDASDGGKSYRNSAVAVAGTFFSQEVIREFQVVRSSGSAEFGRASGGIINIVTQSGANTVRGDAYLYLRDDRLDATNPLAATKLPLDQKQYGITLSGPLVRERMFFFSNVERMRQRSGGVITIDAANVAAINARLAAASYPGPPIGTGNFDTTLDSSNVFLRADAALAPAAQLMVRYGRYDVDSANARNVGGLSAVSRAAALENRDQTLAVTANWSPASDLISETRAQATRSRLAAPPNDLAGPAVNISGIASFGTMTFSPTARDIDLLEVDEVLTWLRGRHAIKAGAAWLQNRVRIAFPGALQGVYGFANLADFLAGRYSTFQQAFGNTETRQTNDNAGLFIEDEWRVSPRLLVNGGIRYDVQHLPSIVETDRDNVAPRFGLAFDPRGDGSSVIRAAAGIYYDRIPLRAVANALQRDGVTYRVAQVGRTFPGAPSFPNVFAAFPSNVLTNITTIDPNIENSSSLQATLQYERQLGRAASASVAYEHLRGHGIIMSRNVNVDRADPRFANNNQYQSIGDSWYDGVTVAFAKRPSAASSFRVSYTYSKALDTAGNFFFSTPQDNRDIAAERGRSDNDQRHRLTLSGSLDLRGWMLSGIFAYTSALPFNIQLPSDRNGDTNFNDRPAGVGRNAGRGFDYRSLDLRVGRRFALGHGVSLDASLDAFNVFDRANVQVPNNIITSPTFGRPTAANDPRQLQLGVRIAY